MRKLLAASVIAAGAMGVSAPSFAVTTVYDIDGTFASSEHSCSQITFLFGGKDCSFGGNRTAGGGWTGPLFGGGHYTVGSAQDLLTYVPTAGDESPAGSGTFVPAADDSKLAAPITGTFSIDDKDTPALTDDEISASFAIGAMARSIQTGQSSRAVQRWTTMDHVIAPTTVSSATANGSGGVDYVIGSRGFPTKICNKADATDCFTTANASNDFAESRFWENLTGGRVGIERSGLLGDPAFTNVQPPPAIPTGNVGATSTATFTGASCEHNDGATEQCDVGSIVWGAGEDAGFDNIVMKISTNASGAITSAEAYYTQEYAISLGGAPAGYDNSWQGGTFTFTGAAVGAGPDARDFAASVLQGSSGNTLDTVTNSVNFDGAVTVTIITGPTLGTATVNGDETINYNSTGAAGTDTIVYEATDGTDTDQGTITITVEADTLPVAPDGPMSISTQGAAPGATTVGSVDVSTLGGYVAGNSPSVVSITTAADPAKGTATAVGNNVRYTPAATFFTGTDTFGYTITDSNGDTDAGVISVTIPDLTPVLADGAITTDQDTTSSALSLGITAGNGSVAQHTLAVTTAATSGTCVISGTSLTYTPNADFFGTDSCVVTITDEGGAGDADTGTISITVDEVSDDIKLPGGGGAVDLWSLSLLGALPLLRRRRRA